MEDEITKLCIWREARSQSLEGIKAVCWVIRNRMRKQNRTSFEIVTAPMQFSSMTIHTDQQLWMYPRLDEPAFKLVCATWDTIKQYDEAKGEDQNNVNALYADNTSGATFYRNTAISTSVWFDNAVRDGKLIQTVQIGQHTFYKEAS